MAVELVHRRLRDTLGGLYHAGMVTARSDIPQRTDIEAPINYRQNRHVLIGEQEGKCNGCQMEFPFKMFEVDHVVPRSRGGTDHKSNLQLLCSPCNRIKGDRPMEYLMARLAEYARPAARWTGRGAPSHAKLSTLDCAPLPSACAARRVHWPPVRVRCPVGTAHSNCQGEIPSTLSRACL